MVGALVVLYIWAVIAIVVGGGFAYLAYRYYKKARKYCKMQEDIVKKVELRTKKEYNKIATLPPPELSSYLTVVFSRELIFASDQEISEKQKNAHETLYATALSGVHAFLGEETVAAIEYYYGKEYVDRWCRKAYLALEHDNVASSIIQKERDITSVARRMHEWF
ncbi:MAG: hypothetical protein NC311_05590 [Muribaculaceae bacterium]|nr:hypothetical protein [Muribaculaceae bacterium]